MKKLLFGFIALVVMSKMSFAMDDENENMRLRRLAADARIIEATHADLDAQKVAIRTNLQNIENHINNGHNAIALQLLQDPQLIQAVSNHPSFQSYYRRLMRKVTPQPLMPIGDSVRKRLDYSGNIQ